MGAWMIRATAPAKMLPPRRRRVMHNERALAAGKARKPHLTRDLQVLFCGTTPVTVRLERICDASNARVAGRRALFS